MLVIRGCPCQARAELASAPNGVDSWVPEWRRHFMPRETTILKYIGIWVAQNAEHLFASCSEPLPRFCAEVL